MRFCLILGCLSAAAMTAAESVPGDAVPERMTLVVRADPATGRLVRSAAASSRKGNTAAIDEYVRATAARYDIDPTLVRAVLEVESNYDPAAVSKKGALGLMQLMPGTAKRFAVKNAFNPLDNIDGGVRYLKYLLTLFQNTDSPEALAIAAYNSGEGAVIRHGGVPPYAETTQYVRKVSRKVGAARSAAAAKAERDLSTQAAANPPIEQFVDERGILHIQTRPSP